MKRGKIPPAKSPMKPFYYALIAVAVIGIGLMAASALRKRHIATEPVVVDTTSPQELLAAAAGISRGPADAPVKMLAFIDYTCPTCGRHAMEFEPIVRDSLLPTGKLQEVIFDFPLGGTGEHLHSFLAARSARCANDQGKFWEYHHLLFERQREWAYNRASPIDRMIGYGESVGLDPKEFRSCIESDRFAEAVSASHELGLQLGVNSTPTIIVNGRIPRWSSFPDLKEAVKKEMGM
jgi:protein-disulfide isomerase